VQVAREHGVPYLDTPLKPQRFRPERVLKPATVMGDSPWMTLRLPVALCSGLVTAGECLGGVRPSSGAAMLESDGDVMKSGAAGYSMLAAPEDGRTPPTSPPPSLRDYSALNIPAVIFADFYYSIHWMRYGSLIFALIIRACVCGAAQAAITPEQAAQLPPPAGHAINFTKEIKPIFEASCINCHGHGRDKGGFRLDTRDTALQGGDSGPAVILPGKSADSLAHSARGRELTPTTSCRRRARA
jgi:hypothetical protein